MDAVAYADDVILMVEGNNRKELEYNIKESLRLVSSWSTSNKLRLSVHKTKYILLKGKLTRNPVVIIENTCIGREKSLRYLGVWLDEKQNFLEHIITFQNKSINVMNKITRLARNSFKIPTNIFKIYHDAILVAITGYAASVWAHRPPCTNTRGTRHASRRLHKRKELQY